VPNKKRGRKPKAPGAWDGDEESSEADQDEENEAPVEEDLE